MHRPAFTLTETVAAMVILGVAMPAMLTALTAAHHDRVAPVLASQARWLAVEQLETVIADRSSPRLGWEHIHAASYPPEPSVPGMAAFAREVSITETGPDLQTAGEGYKTVIVTVRWSDRGRERALELATILTELPS